MVLKLFLGKSSLVEGIVTSIPEITFFRISPSTISKSLFGESEAEVRKIFQECRSIKPSVLFIDELDGIAT